MHPVDDLKGHKLGSSARSPHPRTVVTPCTQNLHLYTLIVVNRRLSAYPATMDVHGAFDVSALDKMFEGLAETLTAEQAAELLGITPRTVRSLIGNKTDPLPAIRLGNSYVILRDDFKAWLLRRSNYQTD